MAILQSMTTMYLMSNSVWDIGLPDGRRRRAIRREQAGFPAGFGCSRAWMVRVGFGSVRAFVREVWLGWVGCRMGVDGRCGG